MIIGLLQLEIMLFSTQSLKDKRSILKHLKNLVRKKFNVALAELSEQDKIRKTLLGFTTINTDPAVVQNTLNAVEKFIENEFEVQITDRKLELI